MGRGPERKRLSRLDVTSRVAAAAIGGYGLAYSVTACLMLALPFSKTEAILTATMLSFLIYMGAIIWAFAAPTSQKAWLGLIVPTAICAAIAWPLAHTSGG